MENFILEDIFNITRTNQDSIEWCRSNELLPTTMLCHGVDCALLGTSMKESVCSKRIDALRFRCTVRTCRKDTSIRKGSFFEHSHLTISQIIRLIYFWAFEIDKQSFMLRELKIGSQNTVVDWKNFCRDICAEWYIAHPVKIGGVGHIVEIDEAMFVRRKYNRGHLVREQWIFGGIDNTTKQCFVVAVPQRNAITLLPIIQQYVLPGTTIVSDLWRAYNTLGSLGYIHLTVNHSIQFVNPENHMTTNHIESLWQKAKMRNKRHYGTATTMMDSYLLEFMWRCEFGQNPFANFIKHIQYVYPL